MQTKINNYTFSVSIDDNVLETFGNSKLFEIDSLTKFIQLVLDNPNGWKKIGHVFTLVAKKNDDNDNNIHFQMTLDETIKEKCQLNEYTCVDMKNKIIFLNADKWILGAGPESKMNINQFRLFMILHSMKPLLL